MEPTGPRRLGGAPLDEAFRVVRAPPHISSHPRRPPMLNVALIGLMAGSLALGTPGGGDDKKNPNDDKTVAHDNRTPGVFETAQGPETITQDTYAFGVPADEAPIKLWVSYAWGESESIWGLNGETDDLYLGQRPLATNGDIVSQRVNVGAQVNFISFPAFKLGAGAQLTAAKNEFQVGGDGDPLQFGDLESDFGLQGLKVFGTARGRVVGLHGGYVFDLGSEQEFENRQLPVGPGGALVDVAFPTDLANSDGRDAITFGADFDYPSEMFRLFGGVDHFIVQGVDADAENYDGDITSFLFGAGVKLSVFEVGAAAQIQTVFGSPTVSGIGTTEGRSSHVGSVAPYVRISPPSLPASLFVKGAVQNEYTEYGYPIGGANSVKPSFGFTVGLSVGFE